jgi:hypothetical protein
VAESFRSWDWRFRFWDARCNTATQSEYVAVFGKMIISGSPKKGRLIAVTSQRWIVTAEQSGLRMRIAATKSVPLCARMKS